MGPRNTYKQEGYKKKCKNKGCPFTARVKGYCNNCYNVARYHEKKEERK